MDADALTHWNTSRSKQNYTGNEMGNSMQNAMAARSVASPDVSRAGKGRTVLLNGEHKAVLRVDENGYPQIITGYNTKKNKKK